jgi:Putative polyhydroxyalkanoic acid system protein (PHA_gran_rgn)
MSGPISVDLPHRLGAAEAKRRIAANTGNLAGHLPAGAQVRSSWQGDRLNLGIGVMGQDVEALLDVQENIVRVTVMLPPALAFFGKAIEAGLRRSAPQLLEDRSKKG